MNPINFIKSVIAEIKKVEWLNRRDLVFYSSMVVAFMVFSTVFIALLDVVLVNVRTFLLTSNIF